MSTAVKPAAQLPVAPATKTAAPAVHSLSKQAVYEQAKSTLCKTVEFVINPSNITKGALNFALIWAALNDGKNTRHASETAAKIVLLGAGADLAAHILNPKKNGAAPTPLSLVSAAFAYTKPALANLIPGGKILSHVGDWLPLAATLYSRTYCNHC